MHAVQGLSPTSRGRRRTSWCTHLYIVAATLLIQAAPLLGQAPGRELLNSERIEAAFGSYGVEVLEQDDRVRVSNLFSLAGEERTCRTFAVVRYAPSMDPIVGSEHAAIVAGGSIGAVFSAQGWEVRKTHLSYSQREASPRLASLMRVAVGTPLAEHVYALDVVKDGRVVEYAALVEIHHPVYLDVKDLAEIYGPVDGGRERLVAEMRSTADGRTR
jgi:hypothetical protein